MNKTIDKDYFHSYNKVIHFIGVYMDKLKGTDTVRLIQLIKDGENSSDAFAELMSRYEPLIEARVSAFFDSAAILSDAR